MNAISIWRRQIDAGTAGLVVLSASLHAAGLCAVALDTRLDPVYEDVRRIYDPIAQAFVQRGAYTLHGSEAEAANVQPLFVAVLIFVRSLGGQLPPFWMFGLFNAALRLGAAFLVRELATLAFGGKVARWALALVLLDPWSFYWSAFLAKESLAVLLFLWGLLAIARAHASRSTADALGAGLVVSVAFLARLPSALLLVPGLLCLLRMSPDPRAGRGWLASSLLLGFVAGSGLWVARSIVFTNWPLPGSVGHYFYTANAPRLEKVWVTTGFPNADGLDWSLPRRHAPRGTPRARTELANIRAVVEERLGNPRDTMRLVGMKAWNMWRPTFRDASTRNLWLLAVPYIAQMAFALAGLWMSRRSTGTTSLLRNTLLLYATVSLVWLAEIRFRQYLMPLLLIFAADAARVAYVAARGLESSRRGEAAQAAG